MDKSRNPLLWMAKLFWGAGVLFVPISLFLASKFGTPSYSGPGGWGSGFMILLVGILAISPSLVVNGFFALLVGHQLAKRYRVRAALFGLLFGAGLAALVVEIYLLLLYLRH